MTSSPNGIAGLVGREPIGAALTVGIKGANGAPTEKDRFHILDATAALAEFKKRDGGTYSAPARETHPAFTAFNTAAADRRRVIPARLAHGSIADLFEFRRQCASGAVGIPTHPVKGPVCLGNGGDTAGVAQRWDGKDYQEIVCPGDRCKFAQPGPNDRNGRPTKPACGPWMRFLARFEFPATPDGRRLPAIPFKFTSGSWNTIKNFVGFFDSFRRACEGFGLDPARVPLFGLPVLLTLTEKSNPAAQSRFPVVSIQVAGEGDLVSWIQLQLQRGEDVRRLAASAPMALIEMQEAGELAEDQAAISGPLGVR